ncbi:ABC transporter ATP-binding protein [Geobacter sp. SVR]|uniref:ABC transporter ATP-binding protein n=1 Tax=Geobacter sp. SVR TaxID=2495594 RepID=UPI00143EFD2C|nr:ABC transporter ATP-binding protein [Geobacter sp. SVR]BCS53800.1 ABC transporter ATP-binding protein [Geobacter sp. SVR]GCF85691.1 ABC transporter ATP-binding protein [Geobacter sp. SVR]
MNAIEINGLCKQFIAKRRAEVDALKELSLSMEEGEIFGFLGPNGAGKSTTIKCLMGLIRPTAGTATVMGERIGTVESRQKVGFLPENPAFYDYLSAEEYLRFVGRTFKMPEELLARRMDETIRLLELWDARKRPMRGYSKGMVQRVGLAQTLIHDPEVYILDEPMSGLDPLGRALVKEIILDLKKRGKSVFFSTHITDDVEKVCDRVGVIVQGRLMALDSVENIMRSGIEGYIVQTRADRGNHQVLAGFERLRGSDLFLEYLVPASQFNRFVELTGQNSVEITLIETKRKDLEAFFLEIVEKEKGKA